MSDLAMGFVEQKGDPIQAKRNGEEGEGNQETN